MRGKNDRAWECLFERHHILSEIRRTGFFEIEASAIRAVREPRLMSKFDHQANLPEVFKEHGLAILPISRSRYVIGPFAAYQNLAESSLRQRPRPMPFPAAIRSIDPADLYSETAVLHCAYVSGIIDDVMGQRAWPTISGRMSTGDFDFMIRGQDARDYWMTISKSQLEIDGGYEGESQIMVVEAKNESVQDFLIRQIYYPYRLWTSKLGKAVVPVFLTFSNDIFSFYLYEFADLKHYNSLQLVATKTYMLAHQGISRNDIIRIVSTVGSVVEPEIPFPQADRFGRVVDLLGILSENDLETDDITTNYAFDKRQSAYYTNAGRYLGLIERYATEDGAVAFRLSATGRDIMRKPFKEKYLMLATCILGHQVFRRVIQEAMRQSQPLSLSRIVYHMRDSNLYKVESDSTYLRRAQTVGKWVDWILALPTQ